MSEPAIAVSGLERRFGKVSALDGLSLEVPEGSVTGFLGANGAGKTTTIRILVGLLRRHGGTVAVLGHDPASDDVAIRRRTGFVPEDPYPEPHFTPAQNLAFFRAFRPTWDRELEARLLERLELDVKKPTKSLSRGERAKLALITALAFRPELLILDDPTSGLDPLARREFIEGIVEVLAQEGKTVFFSTHIVEDLERVADRVVMIKEGRTLYAAEMDQIRTGWRLLRLHFPEQDVPPALKLPGLRSLAVEGRTAQALFDSFTEDAQRALAELPATHQDLPLSLEDIYVELARSRRPGGER